METTSRRAFALVADSDTEAAAVKAIEQLDTLKHVGIPIASVVLMFYDPTRFGAIDPNAWSALRWSDDGDDFEPEDYGLYLVRIRHIAKECGLTTREVDAALYWLGS